MAVFRPVPSDAAAAGAALTAPGSGELTAFERLCDDAEMGYLVSGSSPLVSRRWWGYLYAREAEFTRHPYHPRMAGLADVTLFGKGCVRPMSNYKIAVLGDKDSVLGFKALG